MELGYHRLRTRPFTFRLNWFLSGMISLSILAWFFNTLPPKEGSVIVLGIFLLLATLVCFLISFVNNVRHVVLISGGVGAFLVLRALKLHDPLYILLLLAFLCSLEYAFKRK